MKLHVANCSKQEFLFTYTIPENPRAFSHSIRAGTQILINESPEAVDAIIRQHEIYGFQEASKVSKGFGGLCYRIDKPVSVNAIEAGLSQVDQEQIDRALEARSLSAAAADQKIATTAQDLGLRQGTGIEVDILEEKQNAADNNPKFAQTLSVVREGISPGAARGRGRPRKH